MPFSSRCLGRGTATFMLLSVALFGSEFADATAVEVSTDLWLVISGPQATCTDACAKNNLFCTYESLRAAEKYYPASRIKNAVELAGGTCTQVPGERVGTPNPMIDKENRCYGKVAGESNFNCNLASGMDRGRRLCACYPESKVVKENNPPPIRHKVDPPLFPTVTPTPGPTPVLLPATQEQLTRVPPDFRLVWCDNFDGNDIDPDNWSRGLIYDRDPSQHVLWHPHKGGPHLLGVLYDGYIMDRNTVVSEGAIRLKNKVEDPPIQGTWPSGTFPHSSGFANSLRKVYFNGSKRDQGIFVNVRAKFPSGNVGKVWSAIWMIPEAPVWPPEIDLWEYFGIFFNPDWAMDSMQYRIRYGWYGDDDPNSNALKRQIKGFTEDFGPGYHVYGFMWTWHQMKWFIDGVEVGTLINGEEIERWQWPDEDMAFVLQNGLMESVDPNEPRMPTDFPNSLDIDWICVFERPLQ